MNASPMVPLNAEAIRQAVFAPGQPPPSIAVVDSIDSTNRCLLEEPWRAPNWVVLLAEEQTAGRGRRGRQWRDSKGRNLAMSVGWRYRGALQALPPLSLVVGVAVARAIEQAFDGALKLKWPNDLLVDARKLGGILVENRLVGSHECRTVIGVGINGQLALEAGAIDQPWTDLATITGVLPDRNRLAAAILTQLMAMLPLFEASGFAPFRTAWCRRAAWLEEDVMVSEPTAGEGALNGRLIDVDEDGRLRLSTEGGLERVSVGTVSLRRA